MADAKISDNTVVATPLRNIISLIAAAAVGTWAYFGVIERLNQIETNITLMSTDLKENTEFRIKWPRGEMGSLPADSEQFMLIEHIAGQLEKLAEDMIQSDYEKKWEKVEERNDLGFKVKTDKELGLEDYNSNKEIDFSD